MPSYIILCGDDDDAYTRGPGVVYLAYVSVVYVYRRGCEGIIMCCFTLRAEGVLNIIGKFLIKKK